MSFARQIDPGGRNRPFPGHGQTSRLQISTSLSQSLLEYRNKNQMINDIHRASLFLLHGVAPGNVQKAARVETEHSRSGDEATTPGPQQQLPVVMHAEGTEDRPTHAHMGSNYSTINSTDLSSVRVNNLSEAAVCGIQ